ncbi:MAG TPA: c-type cytochrome [Variovorax sp.]|nr:c-type cytochrome [Variovorax sp.]
MKAVVVLSVAGFLSSAGPAFADDEMYKTKNCFACHRIDKNYHGPSFQSVAAKYADDQGADTKLAQKIRDGSVGVWGQSPMPAQTQVTEAEALTLARWILGLK